MTRMAAHLRKEGFAAHTPTVVPNWGQVGLDELARQLSSYIDANVLPGENFDLIGFSMGGMICRYYLQRLDGLRRVDRFITIGAPHHGSVLAHFINNPGCRQMRPDSDFIRDLNSDIATLEKVHFTSIWTPLDLIILPSDSSRTAASRNIICWLADPSAARLEPAMHPHCRGAAQGVITKSPAGCARATRKSSRAPASSNRGGAA